MAEFTPSQPWQRSTAHASLAALGVKLCELDLLAPLREGVTIPQKGVKFTPFDKLYHCFIAILAGARGIIEINEGLRADPALQAAFGCSACAEQSVIQDTLNAATKETVAQMEAALDAILRTHSQAAKHDYTQEWQLLDVDFSGLQCGKKAEGATKGFFDSHKSRRGRQLGRVLAARYGEIVLDRLYPGNRQLLSALPELLQAAERRLQLTPAQRARTILRVDAGGGSVKDINGALSRDYHYHGKDFCGARARKLAETVTCWYVDPKRPEREVGWVEEEATEYVRPVRRLAVRCRKPNGQWAVGVVISTLATEMVLALTGQPAERASDPAAVALAYADFYDDRGGGLETSLKGDKQGLGITKRNKKRFVAQQMVVALNMLAHNVLVWAKSWLEPTAPAVRRLGIQRLVRDLFGIRGTVETTETGAVSRILLNEASPLARRCLAAFQLLVSTRHVVLILGQT
jgi:hypothetical protein